MYYFIFLGRGHHDFLNLHKIWGCPLLIFFIFTLYIISACLSIVLRLTVVVHLHYLSFVKRKLIANMRSWFKWEKTASSCPYFLFCNQGLINAEYYNSFRDFSPQVALWVSLNLDVREGTSLNIFKKNITKSIPHPPK